MKLRPPSEPLITEMEIGPITVASIQAASVADVLSTAAVAREIRAILMRSDSPNILLDFGRVEHLSMGFLGSVKTLARELEMRGGTLSFCALKNEVLAVLESLGLDDYYAGPNIRAAAVRHITAINNCRHGKMDIATTRRHRFS